MYLTLTIRNGLGSLTPLLALGSTACTCGVLSSACCVLGKRCDNDSLSISQAFSRSCVTKLSKCNKTASLRPVYIYTHVRVIGRYDICHGLWWDAWVWCDRHPYHVTGSDYMHAVDGGRPLIRRQSCSHRVSEKKLNTVVLSCLCSDSYELHENFQKHIGGVACWCHIPGGYARYLRVFIYTFTRPKSQNIGFCNKI